MEILQVVGARPNFMKLAPVHAALCKYREVNQQVIHTGQHYDSQMSEIFFRQLGIPEPDLNLEIGSGSHSTQTARAMMKLEPCVRELQPDLAVVYGDVNSTLATALVCAKLGVPVAHVEAGLRSFDRAMPEEINRVLTDQLSELLFTPSSDGNRNLRNEGVAPARVHLVGNLMIDTLVRQLPRARALWEENALNGLGERPYVLVTLHRPSNVDDPGILARLVNALEEIARDVRVLFPTHPRTRQRIADLVLAVRRLELLEPVGYLEFLALETRAVAVITDSGGIQEETTFLGVPCLTVRENTERPVTITEGTNRLVGAHPEKLSSALRQVMDGAAREGRTPLLWDGHAAERVASVVLDWWQSKRSQTRGATVAVAAAVGHAKEA